MSAEPILVLFDDRMDRFESVADLAVAYREAMLLIERQAAIITEAREEYRPPADPDCDFCLGSAQKIVMVGDVEPEPTPVTCHCIRFTPEPVIAVEWTAF